MKFVIAIVGSGGDLNPLLGIGQELRRRGHDVVVLAGEWQEAITRRIGLEFRSVLSTGQFDRFRTQARKSTTPGEAWVAFFQEAVLPAMSSVYADVAHHRTADTVLIGSSHAIGLRLAAEKHGLPLIVTRLQPQPALVDERTDEGLRIFNRLFSAPVNRLRLQLGLSPLSQPFDRWLVQLERAVAMFPSWFVCEGIDAAEQGSTSDFVLFDPSPRTETPRQTDTFLAEHERPIVFTHGTGNDEVRAFFAGALDACRALDRPAIFMTAHREQLPQHLPREIHWLDYFPFEKLLPHAAAILYHGGIGTCAQALKAGIPHLVMPVGFDQHQNAERIERLGVGAMLETGACSASALTRALESMLTSTRIRARCADLRARFTQIDGLQRCCDLLIEHAG